MKKYKNYQAMTKAHQDEWDAAPIHFAICDQQIPDMLEKFGVKSLDEVSHLGFGMFAKNEDVGQIKEMIERHHQELEDGLNREKFATSAMLSEFKSHECAYTGDWEEGLRALGLTLQDTRESLVLRHAFQDAKREALASLDY